MSAAVPTQLMSSPKVNGMKSISNKQVEIYPVNSSQTTAFTPNGNNMITFNIPAYKSGFFNPTRSVLRFTAKTGNAKLGFVAGVPVFNRMVLRAGNGMVLEDIQDYSVIQRILSNFDNASEIESKQYLTGDFRGTLMANTEYDAVIALQNSGTTCMHPLLSGLLGKYQEHYIPVGLFYASGGYSFSLELYLEDPSICLTQKDNVALAAGGLDYELTNVTFQTEVVTLPDDVTDRMSRSIDNNETFQIPFGTFKLHKAHISTGSQAADLNISESSKDLETVYTVLRPQSLTLKTDVTSYAENDDNLKFHGGKTDNALKSYQFRYGTEMYPSRAAENVSASGDSKVMLINALTTLDIMDGKMPLCAGYDSAFKPLWDNAGMFTIVQSFKSSRDPYNNSLNTSGTGMPLQLFLTFKAAVSANLQVHSYCKINQTLNVMKGGLTSIVRS